MDIEGKRTSRCSLIIWLLLILCAASSHAQMVERICNTNYRINPDKVKELSFELDNISFFKNNEFDGMVLEGYTLPGLWVQPKLVYYPTDNIRLEAGAHLLWYSGAYQYPCFSYMDIANWKGSQYQRGAHVLPYFRAQLALGNVHFVLGNIYGGSNHRLIDPLFNPELNLTADPEAGLQLLYSSRYFDLDVWANWQSFIFRSDTHQEEFTFGVSSRVKLNRESSPVHCYIPLQILAQHRGGELDTITDNSVQTLMNGAVGLGVTWNMNRRVLKRINLEFDAAGYYQQAGKLWPFDKGFGLYGSTFVDLKDFRIKVGYWQCDNFVSMFGIPYFGAVSMAEPGATYDKPQTLFGSVEYSRTFAKRYSIGLKADIYQYYPGVMKRADGSTFGPGTQTGFSVGAYIRLNPSFLIKKF